MCGRSGQSMMTEGELTMQSAGQSYQTRDASCLHGGTACKSCLTCWFTSPATGTHGKSEKAMDTVYVLFCCFVLWYWVLNLGPLHDKEMVYR